jgi:GrpB-like predicted nucleotidyltransferase (UPF0157 family)
MSLINQKISIQAYNPNWATQLQALKEVLLESLQNKPIEIEHVVVLQFLE